MPGRGLNQEQDTDRILVKPSREGKPGPLAHTQLEGRSNPQGMKLGDHTARHQPRYQTEKARKASAASHRLSSRDYPLANRQEEEEIQANNHADGETGSTDPWALIKG